jgi:hypothetical protein
MKIIITETQDEKVYDFFKKMMSEYSNLLSAERVYDFWDSKKGSYVDFSPINFYDDPELDWEDDDWIFQYVLSEPYTGDKKDTYPMLLYSRYDIESVKKMFGPYFESLFKKWFEETYDLKINKLVDDSEGNEILDIYY